MPRGDRNHVKVRQVLEPDDIVLTGKGSGVAVAANSVGWNRLHALSRSIYCKGVQILPEDLSIAIRVDVVENSPHWVRIAATFLINLCNRRAVRDHKFNEVRLHEVSPTPAELLVKQVKISICKSRHHVEILSFARCPLSCRLGRSSILRHYGMGKLFL